MIAITREPIDTEQMNRDAGHEECGAVLTFSGTVRNHHMGRQVVKLAYEAYDGMAESEMRKVVERAREQWPDVKKVQVVHRFGEMPVGTSSIYITVATPHRPEGFEALRYIIDQIKRDVPIWKKEFYQDGETDWLHPEDGCCGHHLHG
ncbi:MAG: molybdenum cofactor biosynthesis protein MoaE [Acidobacteriota bacterium]|nr:molybdenum cofactor biosynthesis protein MoaE [Acidobacteriota bacterium]